MSTETLVSLAMLKVHIDQGQDYLDYLKPFIIQVLVENKPEKVTDKIIADFLQEQYGLTIPERTIQIVLKRLARKNYLKKEMNVYRVTNSLPDPGITSEKSNAERHIQVVIDDLIQFSESTVKPLGNQEDAIKAICAFLSQFNVICLRAYLRGSVLPDLNGNHDVHIVMVSKYVIHLQKKNPERFDSFMILVKGYMLSNALLCPDLSSAPQSYKGVTFYLDTPLLVRILGLEGEPRQNQIKSLIELLHNLGATVASFAHSCEELKSVLEGSAKYIDSPEGRGSIVMEARRNGTSKSDLLLLAGQIESLLSKEAIKIIPTPKYIADYQIDENKFQEELDKAVGYSNPKAKEYDINSVRSIYVLRRGLVPQTLEKSKAVLVTNNAGFSRAAYTYGQCHEESREVSTVITDFSLGSMAWLKSPVGASSLTTVGVIAVSYAALQPSQNLLDKYLTEIERLEERGQITEQDHQLLRSSVLAQDELLNLTLGDEDALTEETITETLSRITEEIKKEEIEKLTTEQNAHGETKAALMREQFHKKRLQDRLYWRCHKNANYITWFVTMLIAIFLIVGIVSSFGLNSSNPVVSLIIGIGSGCLVLLTLGNLYFGTTVKQAHQFIHKKLIKLLIKRESAVTGINIDNIN